MQLTLCNFLIPLPFSLLWFFCSTSPNHPLPLFRTSTKLSSTKRRCTSATFTNCTTCTLKHRTTRVRQRERLWGTDCVSLHVAVIVRLIEKKFHWGINKSSINHPYLVAASSRHFRANICAYNVVTVWCTEASYTLLLYDELLEWSDRPLREFLNYPMQSEWQRKEYLHLTIVQNFDRGKVSVIANRLCKFFLQIIKRETIQFLSSALLWHTLALANSCIYLG